MRTRECGPEVRAGRLRKAEQFFDAARMIAELAEDETSVGDAFVTLCVHAGVAASDVICCARLGKHAQGENHAEAVALLRSASVSSAPHLSRLLGMKSKAGYTYMPMSAAERRQAEHAAERLLDVARTL